MGTADLADLLQIEGVLAHAGLPDCFPTKGTRSHKEHKRIGLIRDRKELYSRAGGEKIIKGMRMEGNGIAGGMQGCCRGDVEGIVLCRLG